VGRGYCYDMGRPEDQVGQPAPTADDGTERLPHGMGVSSERDEGEVQEVDSREQDDE
jgi:hypothetical protein